MPSRRRQAPTSEPPTVTRGQLWWANLESPEGSEPGFRHPVLIVQSDAFNRSRIATTIAVVVTTNMRIIDAPGNVFVGAGSSGLEHDSVANVSQIITLDRGLHLGDYIGAVDAWTLHAVERGLRLVLGLD